MKIGWGFPELLLNDPDQRILLQIAYHLSNIGYDNTLYFLNTDGDGERLLQAIHDSGCLIKAKVHGHGQDIRNDSDLVEVDDSWKITAFHPKPHPEHSYFRNLVNAGVYILDAKALEYIVPGRNEDWGRDVFPRILEGICRGRQWPVKPAK